MKAKKGEEIRIVAKHEEDSMEYRIGDCFVVEDTWYGGVTIRGLSGIPVSINEEEYETIKKETKGQNHPPRQMRLKKREIKEEEALRQILEDCDVVRIGAVDEEGMFIVPVNYGYEFVQTQSGQSRLKLYFHSAREGRKAELFDKEPDVAIEMDCGHKVIRGDYTCAYSFAFRSIMGNGKIRPVKEKEEKRYGLNLLMRHMEPSAEINFMDEMVERVSVYCIEVTHFTGKQRKEEREAEMRIDHVAMYVQDLEKMKSFYEQYFQAEANQKYRNERTGLETYFLSFADKARLELMTRPETEDGEKGEFQTGYIHLAFSVGSQERVDELTAQLRTDGYAVISGPRRTGDGYYESCILDPEGNRIEVVE